MTRQRAIDGLSLVAVLLMLVHVGADGEMSLTDIPQPVAFGIMAYQLRELSRQIEKLIQRGK